QEIQDRFWIINHRAVVLAIIAGVGFGIIALGLVAIERTFTLLFGLDISDIFYQYLLPVAGLFLVPFYWLSAIENLNEVSAKELEKPDFLSKSIGFLGQFLFVPFLFAYALILLVYAVQIVFTQTMPVGTLGWMVLGFTITGAVAWLLVYPRFMREKTMVKLFRATWFWLTIVPLVLFTIGVVIRLNAYGLTSERMILVAGGVWVTLLTIMFLSKKIADIRLMPLFALVIFLLLSVGPFNISNAPILNQASRLEAAMISATSITQGTFSNPNWSEENAKKAIGALNYLYKEDGGEKKLEQVFSRYELEYKPDVTRLELYKQLELDSYDAKNLNHRSLISAKDNYANLTATPYYLGRVELNKYASMDIPVGLLNLAITMQSIKISSDGEEKNIELTDWLSEQQDETLTKPEIDFTIENINYLLLVDFISLEKNKNNEWEVQRLEGLLFSSEIPKANQ
ncbi:MAG: DUF4153 domain-containing protein, partial [Devosiaceae bacterium]|nr:DUF4153 domain-containing protein [Devosiaceae bacterium]